MYDRGSRTMISTCLALSTRRRRRCRRSAVYRPTYPPPTTRMRVRSVDGPVVIDMAKTLGPQAAARDGQVQHLVEHGLGQAPGEGVLLARLERTHDQQATDVDG